jgi:phosphohistidine swiveling domain-containing protein
MRRLRRFDSIDRAGRPRPEEVEPVNVTETEEPVAVDVPEGYWELEASENPAPISPMAESIFLPALTAGVRHLFAEMGILADTAEWRAIGGWVYVGNIPLAGDERALGERVDRCVEAVQDDVPGRYVQRWEAEWRPWLLRRRDELGRVDLAALDDAGLDAHVGEVVTFLFAATDVHVLLHGSNAVMLGELAFAGRDLLGWSEPQIFDLLSGTSVASTEPAQRLAELADLARGRPPLKALLDDPADAATRLADVDPGFAAGFERYLSDFGDRAIRYEVIDPTVAECPELLLRLVRDQIAAGYDGAAVAERLTARQAVARAAARATLAEKHPEERERFERLLERAERFYPLREDNEVWTQSVPLALTRRALLEVGRRLASSGAVPDPDDVFLLRLPEALQARVDGSDLTGLVAARRTERAWARAHRGPASYGTPPPAPDLSGLPPAALLVHETVFWLFDRIIPAWANERRHQGPFVEGIPASAGRSSGPARVVLRDDDLDRVQPGDVLVCPATSPAWSMAFPSLSALVTDTGGILSHAAIIAREFGIPSVVATGNATEVFADGQIITVDGDAGRVEPA